MNPEKIIPIVRKAMLGFIIFDLVTFFYILISGQLMGELYGTDVILYLSFFVIAIGSISVIIGLIYFISIKQYKPIGYLGGIVGAMGFLYVLIVVLAISSIY